MKRYVYISSVLLFILVITGLFFFGARKATEEYSRDFKDSYKIYTVPLPEKIAFANEPVPLYIADVKERLERELLMNVYYQSQTLLYFKRANRYFPMVEEVLRKNGIPDDFKYIALVESGFQNVVSSSAAVGFWQFIEPTAKQYGLEVNEEVDERYNLEKSTEAACKYLLESYRKFGNWTMAAATYNVGRNGIETQITKQKTSNYYDLLLNDETARYVFRLIAHKLITESPSDYGFRLEENAYYPVIPTHEVAIDSAIPNIADFALQHSTNYKIIKQFNPWLRQNYLPDRASKVYYLTLPDSGERMIQ